MTAVRDAAEEPEDPSSADPLAVRPGIARFAVMLAVFLCAACGMVYELALVALGSYLLGNTIVQASIVLSVMVFAMGVGSFGAKGLVRWPAVSFALVEAALGLVGGLSVLSLYLAFAFLDAYTVAMVVAAFVIGALIGAEIPLLMEILQRIRAQRASSAVADLFSFDYVGGLVGGLAFPFLLLPLLGLPHGALAVGAVNAITGVGVVLWVYRGTLTRRLKVWLSVLLVAVLAVLGVAWAATDTIEITGQQSIYRDTVTHSERSDYQQIVLTRDHRTDDLRMFLNGDLQFSSTDEHRYHEPLVHPAMNGPREDVLILGGGDGMAAREVLEYDDVDAVTLVDLDPAVVELAQSDERISALNEGSLSDPRVTTIAADAFAWLRGEAAADAYDTIIIDLPDPDDAATAKLYTVEFYGLVARALAPEGRTVIQAGSPYFAPEAYWGVAESVRRAGLAVTPYHVDVPSFGDWGFLLAGASGEGAPAEGESAEGESGESSPAERASGTEADPDGPPLGLPEDAPDDLTYATAPVIDAAAVFPPDRARASVGEPQASTLLHPYVIDQHRRAWVAY